MSRFPGRRGRQNAPPSGPKSGHPEGQVVADRFRKTVVGEMIGERALDRRGEGTKKAASFADAAWLER